MTVTVLMGPPGAGKSTWLAEHHAGEITIDTHAVRTVDDLDVDAYMTHVRKVGAAAIRRGDPVIIDATNTYPQHRLYWLRLARQYARPARLVAFDTSLPLLIAAQRRRRHPAPDRIVLKHHRLMRAALGRIHAEGWDQVDVIIRGTTTPPFPEPAR